MIKSVFIAILLGFTTTIKAQQKEMIPVSKSPILAPKGIYAEIEVQKHNKVVATLLNGEDKEVKQKLVDSILKTPNIYNPPVLYALSRELYIQNKMDEAAFWFYTAQLRARYDANLCMDSTARKGVGILNNRYGTEINKYAFLDIDNLEKIVKKVVSFVKNNDENYDHRWINLNGMDAMRAAMDPGFNITELSAPKETWPAIKKKTIDDYYSSFKEYTKTLKK